MTAHVFPFRAKRCNDRALQIVRAERLSELRSYKAERKLGSRALRALEVAVRTYIACAWVFALFAFAALTLGLPAFLIGYAVGHFTR